MEVEEIQTQGHKFRRIGNGEGRIEPNKKGDEQFGDEEEDDEIKRRSNGTSGGVGLDFSSGGRLYGWPSSRIVRVSRASGGKDRHSKVVTSKGLRDRRVRLSVNTAIQFYDLQDRLGYDQPSKAVEWLLKAAESSIAELPPISTLLPDASKQLSDEKSLDSAQVEMEINPNCLTTQQQQQQQQQAVLPKSACSSNSENSKGSGTCTGTLSLSRSESRIKARERARERAKAAEKEKDKENETNISFQHEQLGQNLNPSPMSGNAASFTELLTSGMNGTSNNNHNNSTTSPSGPVGEANFFHKSSSREYSTPMDYFGLLGPASTRSTHGFSGQLHLGSSLQQALTTVSSPLFTYNGDQHNHHQHHHQELQQFSFVQDHFIPVVTTAATGNNVNNNNNNNNNEYNLSFTISPSSSSGLAGFSRGTLQSNSSTPSLLPHIQRFTSIDGSPSTFFIGAAAPQTNAAVPRVENHHLIHGFDAGLQLCYRDGAARHSDQKGQGKG